MFADHTRQAVSPVSHRSGITLIEILVVVACLTFLLVPLGLVFRSGSQTALKGTSSAETTREAGSVLRQVQDDLKNAVFQIDYARPIKESVADVFDRMITGDRVTTYSLLRFASHGTVESSIRNESDAARRIAVRVTYELKKEKSRGYSLYRTEGARPSVLLHDRVNFFEIRENLAAPPKTTWLITLQLIEGNQKAKTPLEPERTFTSKPIELSYANFLSERTRGMKIADFFGVVSSEYFSRFRQSKSVPNWQTLTKSP